MPEKGLKPFKGRPPDGKDGKTVKELSNIFNETGTSSNISCETTEMDTNTDMSDKNQAAMKRKLRSNQKDKPNKKNLKSMTNQSDCQSHYEENFSDDSCPSGVVSDMEGEINVDNNNSISNTNLENQLSVRSKNSQSQNVSTVSHCDTDIASHSRSDVGFAVGNRSNSVSINSSLSNYHSEQISSHSTSNNKTSTKPSYARINLTNLSTIPETTRTVILTSSDPNQILTHVNPFTTYERLYR